MTISGYRLRSDLSVQCRLGVPPRGSRMFSLGGRIHGNTRTLLHSSVISNDGGRQGIRTPDPRVANAMLSQLS